MIPFVAPTLGRGGSPAPTPAPSGITFAVQDFTTGTATGSQTVSSATISGLTPKAAMILEPPMDPTNDPGETPGVWSGIGMADASNDINAGGWSMDNKAATDSWRYSSHQYGYEVMGNGGSQLKRADVSMASGGVGFNYTLNSSPSLRGAYLAFAGANVSAKVGWTPVSSSQVIVNSIGFQPDVILMMSSNVGAGTLTQGMNYSFGVVCYDGGAYTQRSVLWAEERNIADGRPFQTLRNDAACGQISRTDGSLTSKLTINGFASYGFAINPSANFNGNDIEYLALKFTGGAVKLVDFTTPTSTGSQTISGAGFTPRAAIVVLTNLEALNDHPGATSDNQGGLGISVVSDETWASSFRIDSGAPTTDTASQCSNAAIMGASATDCDAILASFSAWTSDGMTVNYSAVQATGKKGFVLFIQ